jgi:hypothetical protein
LANALVEIPSNPEGAVNTAGRALEDFFRIGIASHKNLQACNGIVQIANTMNSDPAFPTKLNNIASALGNVRTLGAAHGVDKKLHIRWQVQETTAYAYFGLLLATIKSYLVFLDTGTLIF